MKSLKKLFEGFENDTVKVISKLSLSNLNNVPEDVQALWNSSTTTIPRKLDPKMCWKKGITPPDTSQLILGALDQIAATQELRYRPKMELRTFSKGKVDNSVDPRLAVVQLCVPDNRKPVSIIGLDIGKEIGNDCFLCPESITEYVGAHRDEDDCQLILTPKYTHTDLHIDTADGISAALGQCDKLWVMYPPTMKNLEIYQAAVGDERDLVQLGRKLDGGIITRTNSSEAIYLPAGCLHSVFTLTGGFLVAIDFSSSKACGALASMLNAQIDKDGNGNGYQKNIFRRFLDNIALALEDGNAYAGVAAWIAAEVRWREWAKKNRRWEDNSRMMWDEWFKLKAWKKELCPCGQQKKKTSFANHFRKVHGVEEKRLKTGPKTKKSITEVAVGEKKKKRPKRKAEEVEEIEVQESTRPPKRTKKKPKRYEE